MNIPNKIVVNKLKTIATEGGEVMHALRASERLIKKFGEVYFSSVEQNVIRAWKFHNKMTLNLIVPIGMVKFVFYFEESKNFSDYIIGENNYCRLTVPPKTWFGFQGLNNTKNLIMNIADLEHDPKEMEKKFIDQIKYEWCKK